MLFIRVTLNIKNYKLTKHQLPLYKNVIECIEIYVINEILDFEGHSIMYMPIVTRAKKDDPPRD